MAYLAGEMNGDPAHSRTRSSRKHSQLVLGLWLLVVAQAILYVVLAVLSRRFNTESPLPQRPILLTLGLLSACFVFHLWGLKLALQFENQVRVAKGILLAAIVFRGILLFSLPIQEVDIYRYLWDGEVLAEGVNPFRYSPEQVKAASTNDSLPSDLNRLVHLREDSHSLDQALQRVHYGSLTTIYPPVAQVIYALAAAVTPRSATLYQRVVVLKAVLLLFDLGTLLLVLALLHATGRRLAWSILYGWCPLVLKEFANSGHLDAIAVFFTMAAVFCWVRSLLPTPRPATGVWVILTALCLALGTGAKIYPIILLPLFTVVLLRQRSWTWAAGLAGVGVLAAGAILAPMLLTEAARDTWTHTAPVRAPRLPEAVAASSEVEPEQPASGLTAFLQRWEINDLLFMLVFENLRSATDPPASDFESPPPWFVVIPAAWRNGLQQRFASSGEEPPHRMAFLITRGLSLFAFALVALCLGWKAARSALPERWLEMAFLTLAWFWVLSPTLNPWYWSWALPLLPFAKGRAWYVVSGLLLAYYLRFWLIYHCSDFPLLGTPYRGDAFFHFVIVPLEHGIWMLWLLAGWLRSRRASGVLR